MLAEIDVSIVDVAVIVALPTAIAVTMPEESTVAISLFDDVQVTVLSVDDGVVVTLNVCVSPTFSDNSDGEIVKLSSVGSVVSPPSDVTLSSYVTTILSRYVAALFVPSCSYVNAKYVSLPLTSHVTPLVVTVFSPWSVSVVGLPSTCSYFSVEVKSFHGLSVVAFV